MMIKHAAAALCTGLLLTLATATHGQETAIAGLDARLNGVQTMSADVTQLILESDGAVLEESSIRMHLKKPGGFYWETLTPFPELIVTNGQTLWNYQPDLEQVVIEDWNSDRSQLAAQLLSGDTSALQEDYAVSWAGEDKALTVFNLLPLSSDNVYAEIAIHFNDQTLDMSHLESNNGEQTVWQFSAIERNHRLDDQLFNFDPPSGIEIIQNNYSN